MSDWLCNRLRMHQQEACMPLIRFATLPDAASRKRYWHTSCMAAASSSASWKVAASACACFSRSASLPASSGLSLACPSACHVITADRRHGGTRCTRSASAAAPRCLRPPRHSLACSWQSLFHTRAYAQGLPRSTAARARLKIGHDWRVVKGRRMFSC